MTTQNINNSRGFRYVRYVGPNNVRCNIAELAFYGYPGEGDDSHLAQTTNIPDVIIHTTDCQDILDRENYIKGIVSFISGDGATFYTDSVEIRGRGNYSWTSFDKKPYRIKLAEKTNVLGFPAEARNWTLISNHSDKTLMRNLLAFDLSKRMEMPYTPAGRPVNLYLNGEYKGCYQLCDHIDVRKKRVDVKEMKITDISGENLTGGYLIEADAYAKSEPKYFTSNRNTNVTIKSPDSEEITTQQFNYIRNHFNLLESTLYASTYTNPTTGFRKHLDTKTFIRHFLVGELSGNTDTYWSTYFYKQRNDDKFYVGPVWDFDIAFENDNRTYPINNYPDFIFRKGSVVGDMRNFVNRLLSDTQLYNELKQTYADYRDWGYLTEKELMQTIDDYAAEMETSQQLNFTRWDVLNKRIHQNNQPAGSYTGEVNVVKNYLKNRLIWMDNKLNYVPNPNNKPTFLESAKQSSIAVWTESNRIHVE
ncbi:MAG: CotH kinase family protein, partial [Dysgonamonadaceae bacterium]|nr:CotH kinase family protein [Dysgonamonadaceae bacterium]